MEEQLSTAVRSKSYSGFVSNPPTMATEQSVWAKVAALEMSIAAVEQEQERVEAAIRSRTSVFALPDRLRHFVVGTVDDPHQEDDKELNLGESLRWLRTKEVQLRKEKLLLIQHEICGSGRNLPQPQGFPVINSDPPILSAYSPPTAGDRNLSPPERQSLDEVDGSMLQVSYLSSRKMWSAADSTDCPLGAPHLPQKEPASDPQVNGESKTSRGRTALKPGRSVRNGSAGPKRFAGIFFNGFRRSGASSKKTSHTKKASTARFNAATKSVEAEDASSLEGSKPGGRIEFDFRKPFWQRSFSAARNKEGGGRPRHVRPKRNAPDAPDLSGKQLAPQTHNLSWRRVFGMDGEDKDPKERADGASTFTSTKTSSSREVFDDVESSDDETTENSSSSGHNKPPPPKAPVMMRGHSQRVAHLSVAVASERRPHCQAAPSGGSTSASFPASSGCAIKEPDLRRSRTPATLLNRKVRFEVPSSDLSDSSDSRSPLVSPRAKPGTIDAPKRSTAAIVEAQRGLSGKSVKNTETASQASQELPRPASEEALSPSLANPAGGTKPMLASNVSQKLPRPASEEALPPSLANPAEAYLVKDDQETGAGRRKLHRRYSSDDGSLVARMAVKNEAGSLLLAERGSIQCAEDAATIEMQMAVMWTTGAYSPTKFASVGAPCRTNNMVSSQRSILSSSGGNVLGPLGHANRDGRSLRHTPRAIANRRLADKIDSAVALAPTWLPPADDDIGRDTLEKIYRFLASSLALTDGQDKQRGCQLAAEALEKLPATVASGTPPPVWVTRYVDKSMKYGLGFLLSDGSVGVRFNDATKIVLEATGGAFEYVDRQQKKPSAQIGTEEGVEETVGLLHPWRIPRPRQGLRDHAPRLEKKVRLLKYFHKDLRKLGGDSYHDSEGKEEGTLGEPATPAGESSGPTEPLTVVEKWRRTRHSCLFLLSTLTVQVVFADTTQILLSEEGRVVTFVDAARNRHTLTLCSIFQEQRMDIIKRVRSSNDLILQLLTRDERVNTSSIEAGTVFVNEGPKANDNSE